MTLTLKLLAAARADMLAEFDQRATRAARALKMQTRAQAHKRSPEGRAAARVAVQQGRAIEIGQNYHKLIDALYTSKRGDVQYGRGGAEHVEFLYSRSYKFPARWRDGGARVEGRTLIIENYKGTEKARFTMPRGRLAPPECLLSGDCYALLDHDVTQVNAAVRYGPTGRTGYAMLLPSVYDNRRYWEHGADAEGCLAERARKVDLVAIQARAAQESERESRRLRLLARLSSAVMVTRADAAATGACAAGIAAWCKRVGAGDSLPAREVVRLATETGERRAMAAAMMACRRALQA